MSESQPVVFLKGKQVTLRPIEKEDLATFARWINDPEIRDYIKSFVPMTAADEEEWFASLGKRKPNNISLAMVTSDGVLIGNIALHNINWRSRIATTGTLIGEKEYWSKGLGTEAKILLLHYAFDSLNLRKICSQVIAYNTRSQRYSEKCGYKPDGILKDHVFRRGEYWDLINLAVFREDFDPIWEKYQKET
jgi:RimJ/RimL family protein N-acetyltransferase